MNPDRPNGPQMDGWPTMPPPKKFEMHDGQVFLSPDVNRPDGVFHAQQSHRLNGAPIDPVGNPLLAGVGPGAWAARADITDKTHHGEVKIVPLRAAQDHGVASADNDPRGLPVFGADKERCGTVHDLWVDRAEMIFRFIEVKLTSTGASVMLPINFARIKDDGIYVHAIYSQQFSDVPKIKHPEEITLLEEEKIMAYYGAGLLYADPTRMEPLV